MAKRLEIILKLTERCNIACTYCYYFENKEKSALHRPARLTDSSAKLICGRIHEALLNDFCEEVRIIFHGGEPLLYGKVKFNELCASIRSLGHGNRICLCMQTNAMLVDDEWISLFEKYNVAVGVSLDGTKEIHDRNRVDHAGRPTFDVAVAGIKKLVHAANNGKIAPPGALVVIQPHTSPILVFDFIVDNLGITNIDFLLPDVTWDTAGQSISGMGGYLCALYDRWAECGRAGVNVRILKSTLSLFLGGPSFLGGFGPKRSVALTVLSDGTLNADDFLRPCGDDIIDIGMTLSSNSLESACSASEEKLISMDIDRVPDGCHGCAFERVCHGGQSTHRFQRSSGFNNPSVYCESLKQFYEHVCFSLLRQGLNVAHLESLLRNGNKIGIAALAFSSEGLS